MFHIEYRLEDARLFGMQRHGRPFDMVVQLSAREQDFSPRALPPEESSTCHQDVSESLQRFVDLSPGCERILATLRRPVTRM